MALSFRSHGGQGLEISESDFARGLEAVALAEFVFQGGGGLACKPPCEFEVIFAPTLSGLLCELLLIHGGLGLPLVSSETESVFAPSLLFLSQGGGGLPGLVVACGGG